MGMVVDNMCCREKVDSARRDRKVSKAKDNETT